MERLTESFFACCRCLDQLDLRLLLFLLPSVCEAVGDVSVGVFPSKSLLILASFEKFLLAEENNYVNINLQ